MRLAGAGRSVQQQSTLEVLPGPQQRVAMAGDAQRVALHPGEHHLGKDDVLACGLRDVAELERALPPIGVSADIEHVPAVDVQPVAQLAEPGVHRLGRLDRQPGDLDAERRSCSPGPLTMTTYVPRVVGHQQHRQLQAGQRRAGPLGRSTSAGADSRIGGMPSPVISCCRFTVA